MLNSSNNTSRHFVLAPRRGGIRASRLRAFLTEFANLPDSPDSADRFYASFGDMLPSLEVFKNSVRAASRISVLPPPTDVISKQLEQRPPTDKQYKEQLFRSWYRPLRNWLRSAWIAKDQRTKFWLLYDLAAAGDACSETGDHFILGPLAFVEGPISVSLPPESAFEQATMYLLDHVGRTRVCKNPECPARYFFASKRTQSYCSEVCAVPAQRNFKRLWWRKHGKDWRRRSGKEKKR